MNKVDKEPWDLDKFVQYYNAIAKERVGWNFEPDDHDLVLLKKWYEEVDDHRNLRQYAHNQFIFDQQTGVEGSD